MRLAIGLVVFAMGAVGCTATRQPDGSTRVSVSLGAQLGLPSRVALPPAPNPSERGDAAGGAHGDAEDEGNSRERDLTWSVIPKSGNRFALRGPSGRKRSCSSL